jgi:hypothetical protein
MEFKKLQINNELFTLEIKQNMHALWECKASDSAGKEIANAKNCSKKDAQFLVHVTLYDIHGIRRDQACEEECDQGWKVLEEPVHI